MGDFKKAVSSLQMLSVRLNRAFARFGQHLVEAFLLESFLDNAQQFAAEGTASKTYCQTALVLFK